MSITHRPYWHVRTASGLRITTPQPSDNRPFREAANRIEYPHPPRTVAEIAATLSWRHAGGGAAFALLVVALFVIAGVA